MSSLRTKDLVGTVVSDACDVDEAHSSAVAVEEQPPEFQLVAEGIMPWNTFQAFYEKRVANDAGMAKCGGGITADFGSLSHSHFNCGCRNIICAKPGCLCGGGNSTRDGGDSDKQCSCKASPILDANGNYSMDKLKKHDPAWHQLCLTGIKWEVLSWKMDVEEPDVALIISNALNN